MACVSSASRALRNQEPDGDLVPAAGRAVRAQARSADEQQSLAGAGPEPVESSHDSLDGASSIDTLLQAVDIALVHQAEARDPGQQCPGPAVAHYIEELGGRLDLVATFGDHTQTVATTETA